MNEIVVYPNNRVSVDGKLGIWSEREFLRRGILMQRGGDLNTAHKYVKNNVRYILFPNMSRASGVMKELRCGCCKKTKTRADYCSNKSRKSGLQIYCRDCMGAYCK